ncbi:MAG: ribonuclease PH [Eubacteriales bacterium]|nr:ribonuclease PH [Eubacteriales bacterium]
MRQIRIEPNFLFNAAGSALICVGRTRVLCSASVAEGVPEFLKGRGTGWLTAEYAMLPASTPARKERERGRTDSRSTEIQRLIGRSLRAAVDLGALGERTVKIDCDVLDADGGTRTAGITGAYVALALAARKFGFEGALKRRIAAVSVGISAEGEMICDLDYELDSHAAVDMNVVFTDGGELVEVQGTGEGRPYTTEELNALVNLALTEGRALLAAQDEALL